MRKKIIYSLFLLIFVFLALFCSKAKYQSRAAIIFAFFEEGELLRKNMELEDSLLFCGRLFWMGKLQEKDVVVVNSGIGMTNSAMTTQLLIDKFKPKQIIFTGICGGVDPKNHIGDIVIPVKWATHDFGYYDKSGFKVMPVPVIMLGKTESDTVTYFEADLNLLEKAQSIKNEAKKRFQKILDRSPQIRIGGNGVSGNSFIDQVEKREWLKEKFNAEIVDMESAGSVQVANINNVPILVVKSCSDLAGGSGSSTAEAELEEFMKVVADNSAEFVLELLKGLN